MKKLLVAPSPHFHASDSVTLIMFDVIIALIPAMAMSIAIFGARAIAVYAVSIISAVLSEYITRKILKRSNTIGDLSAVVTGILLAMNLPVTIPLWQAALGAAIAIVVVKQLFGGIGQNFVNPALVGRIVLLISFPASMSSWVFPADVVTSATPLVDPGRYDLLTLFTGFHPGCLGETSAVAILIGAVYLICKKVISPIIPLVYIGGTAALCALGGIPPLETILTGGLMLGACFMATDYATTPTNNKGKVIFALGCAAITSLIRLFGNMPEGVSFSIVLMNILVPHIDRLTQPRPFGSKKEAAK
jgi:electron transport complex protein RnfD